DPFRKSKQPVSRLSPRLRRVSRLPMSMEPGRPRSAKVSLSETLREPFTAGREPAGGIAQPEYSAVKSCRPSRSTGFLRAGDRLLSKLPLGARSVYADRFSCRAPDQPN